jgi:hypothetical protein
MKTLLHIGVLLLSLIGSQAAVAGCWPMPIPPFFFCTLDSEGTGTASPPDYFTCHEDFDFESAGGDPVFKIHLTGHCGIHPGGGLPGWTPVPWKVVSVRAEYNYQTGIAEERIWHTNQVMLESELVCSSNPWANSPDCSLQGELINNSGAQYTGPLPVSAYRIPYNLRESLAKWEDDKDEDKELSGWNPYAPLETGGFEIASPAQYEVITENAVNFQLDVSLQPGTDTPQNIQLSWEKIIPAPEVVGDIALPESMEHWWEPFFGPEFAQWSVLPLNVTVNPGYFENKPGLYQLKVRNATGGAWSKPRRFWVGNPSFDPPSESKIKIDKIPFKKSDQSTAKIKPGAAGAAIKRTSPKTLEIKRPATVLVMRPALKVTAVTWKEARARPGSPLDLTVTVTNSGGDASLANRHELFFACLPASDCPESPSVKIPAAVEPGQTYTFTVRRAVQPARTGTRFYVSTEPLNLTSRQNLMRKRLK